MTNPTAMQPDCMCDFPQECDGSGMLICDGCGCGDECPCPGCPNCMGEDLDDFFDDDNDGARKAA